MSSPEEKLLKLIRGLPKRHKEVDGACKEPLQAALSPQPAETPKPVLKKRQPGKKIKIKNRYEALKVAEKALYALIIIAGIATVADSIVQHVRLRAIENSKIIETKGKPVDFSPRLDGDFNDYSGPANKDVFLQSPQILGGRTVENVASFNPAVYVNSIKVLGIISGENPQAVVEDQNESKSYTVSSGDYIGDFLVENIGSGKIRLDYNGQKFDLYL